MKYTSIASAFVPLLAAATAGALPVDQDKADALAKRATDTTTINLDQCSGTPQHYASGVLYGVSGTNTPPQSYLQDLKINYLSVGGAQTPTSGWGASKAAYQSRFATVVADWKRIRANNGVLIIKTSDLWGADATQPSNFPYPGDNGDWKSYDAFVQQIIADVKANGMANSYTTQIEIWNEPDLGTTFWGRSQDQYLEMYLRGVRAFRAAFGKGSAAYLPIVGPSTAGRPESTNAWIAKWLSTLQSNKDATPDIYNWHLEGNDRNDPVVSTGYLRGRLSELGLSAGIGFQNNEYGVRSQQKPGYGAWFAARFEKVKHNGMRGNWASGNLLRDNLADLLLKDGQGAYHTTGEYQEWKTYAGLEGAPCGTTTGSSVDSYAVSSSGARSASALVGNAGFTGSANVVFAKVSSLAKDAKRYQAKVERIPYNGGKEVTGLTAVSTSTVDVANDRISVPIDYADADDAYLVTITAA